MNALHGIVRTAARALGLPESDAAAVTPSRGHPAWASALPVGELAMDSVALASLAMNLVRADRRGERTPAPVRVDADRVAASFGSERLFRQGGEAPAIWAPLSGFWEAPDGWVRTHGNYPHHAARLRSLLGVAEDAGRVEVAEAVRGWDAEILETQAAAVGALVVAVRSPEQWRRQPHAQAVAGTPFLSRRRLGDAPPRPWTGAAAGLPLDGIRVLDLTRVIAGPVATRDLALAGAAVLRVDPPGLPEPEWQHLDTGQGKRSTLLDLQDPSARAAFETLLADADVLITGYRPGALDRFGLDGESLHARRPGLVIGRLSAWGAVGPWRHRRGFDSLVQAATGIAQLEGDARAPGALPVQALDHSAGHFLAAAVTLALRDQRRTGGTIEVSIALARIAQELLDAASDAPRTPGGEQSLPTMTVHGITCAVPPLAFDGAPAQYPQVGEAWGADAATWDQQA